MLTHFEQQAQECRIRFFFGSIGRFLAALPVVMACLGLGALLGWYSLQVFNAVAEQMPGATFHQAMLSLTLEQQVWLAGPAVGSVALVAMGLWYLVHLPQRYRCLQQALHDAPVFFPPR